MKLILRRILPGLLLACLLTLPALGQTQKIATIDLRKVFDNYWKRQEAEAALKKRGADFDKELKGFMDDYKKLQDDYNKLLESANDQSVTPEEREKRKTAAQNKLAEIKTSENTIRTFEDNAREQLDSQRKRMRDGILDDIRTAVNAKAKSGGYAMVIDTAAESFNQTPVIMYTTGENDMTDAILAQLNVGAPPPAASTNEVPASTGKPSGTGK
ncbi:MAG TPA: OmpH family outer membrane protein [Verrucomicrobiae bacterium]|nr:OmpH family outer membrane protein [Verrucomicrobiae bacterium]